MSYLWIGIVVVLVVAFVVVKKRSGGGEKENIEGTINRVLFQEDGNKVYVRLFVATTYNEDLECFFNTTKDKAPSKDDLKNRDKLTLGGRWDQSSTPYTFKVREITNRSQNKTFTA